MSNNLYARNLLKKSDWEWLLRRETEDGHKLFIYNGPSSHLRSNIAIADFSGVYPHETDDGVLWIDLSKPMILRNDGRVKIHLTEIKDDNSVNSCSTLSDMKTALTIQEYAALKIIYNNSYAVTFKREDH